MAAKATFHDTIRQEWQIVSYKVKWSSSKIWKGSPVFVNSAGYAYSNDWTTNELANGDIFVWIADETVHNTGSDGDVEVVVWAQGIVSMPIAAATQGNVWDFVYVNGTSDNAVVTLTSATDDPQMTVGVITGVNSATSVRVALTGVYTAVATIAWWG